MEGFDAVGRPRTKIKLLPDIKKSDLHPSVSRAGGDTVVKDVVIDGQAIDGLVPLKQFLLTHRHEQFTDGFTRHMLSFALGRPLTYRDDQTVLALQTEFEESGYKIRSLIKAIVRSSVFRQGSQPKTHK